jgi:cytoskeleton protein RodZ
MKTVGKQLQEARLAKNWTPELAARETKIKIDRLRDLESDDYSHFTSPTYARGFVRTYARSLGLDEYKILRQLDNKLPDDDSSTIVGDSGVNYLPETSMPPRAAHRDYTGLYIVMGLGAVVTLAITFVLFEAYRVGELSSYFDRSTPPVATTGNTNGTNDAAPLASTARALPVDSNTPPPIVEPAPAPPNTHPASTAAVIPASPTPATNVAPAPDAPMQAVRALPVDPSELTNAAPPAPAPTTTPTPTPEKAPPRALPVDPSELAAAPPADPTPPVTTVALNTTTTAAPTPTSPPSADFNSGDKRLVLTASQDSFVQVTNLDSGDKQVYAAVLHSGQSVGFDGRKFTINVGIPSAVDIKLDGVNYGPHSDRAAPETFNVESHLP